MEKDYNSSIKQIHPCTKVTGHSLLRLVMGSLCQSSKTYLLSKGDIMKTHFSNPNNLRKTLCGHDATILNRTFSNVTDDKKLVDCGGCISILNRILNKKRKTHSKYIVVTTACEERNTLEEAEELLESLVDAKLGINVYIAKVIKFEHTKLKGKE